MSNENPLYLYAVKYNYLCERYDRSLTNERDRRGDAEINHNPEVRRQSMKYARLLYSELARDYKKDYDTGLEYGAFMKSLNSRVSSYSFEKLEREYMEFWPQPKTIIDLSKKKEVK